MPLLQIRIIFQTAACCFIKCFLDFCRCMDFTTPTRRPFPVKFPRKVSLLHCITLFCEFNQIFQLHTEFTNIYSSVAFEPSSVIFTVFRPLFSPVFSLFLFSSCSYKISCINWLICSTVERNVFPRCSTSNDPPTYIVGFRFPASHSLTDSFRLMYLYS